MRVVLVAICVIGCGSPPKGATDPSPSPSPSPAPSPPAPSEIPAPPPAPSPSAPSPLAAAAVAGVSDAGLRAVIAEHWEFLTRTRPIWATTIGDHRYDDQLSRRDAASIAAVDREQAALLARVVALDISALGETDKITYALLRGSLEADVGVQLCKFHEWNVDSANHSLLGQLSYVVEAHQVATPSDAANLIARVRQSVQIVDDTLANWRTGLATGRTASREKIRRAIDQLDRELAKPIENWAVASPKWPKLDDAERDRQLGVLRGVVASQLKPALERLRAFLHDELAPKARGDREGLAGLPDGGDACYRAAIVNYVGLAKTPAELHQLGLAEIARTDREIAALGKKVLKAPNLAATIKKLRTDRALYFKNRDDLMATAQRALDRANAAMPKYFSLLPKVGCVMREIPAYEAPFTTLAYYREPHYDGSKPGEYFLNTYKPETRSRFELEALTWHESVPGHHTQIAIAQEVGELPLFRKLDGSTAFVEGWALYTERLADEMGLYTGDLDRLGKLSYDAWRGSRLVVDTGMHSLGWTRAQAEQYMRDHTALTEVNIVNEVDRYIGWPGQALAYKVGQLEILKLRAEAEAKLGKTFDIKGFHAVVLGAGAVTLPVLAARVHAWMAQ